MQSQVLIGGIASICLLTILILAIKLHMIRKSADEISESLTERLSEDTNTLIDISSKDSHMRHLASSINQELKTLRSQRHKFQQGDWELKEAVTNISHDLRTPLTAIYGYLSLLEQEDVSENAERYLRIIKERTDTLHSLTEELFNYSLVTSSDDLTLEEVVLNSQLEETISAYYASLKGCGITPEITLPDKKVVRTLNKKSLSRIFGNIISNCIKYSTGDLKITLTEQGEITFSNYAPGLDEVQVGQLFERFYTVENAKNSTGLGLSIAKALTEQTGGKITANYKGGILSILLIFRP